MKRVPEGMLLDQNSPMYKSLEFLFGSMNATTECAGIPCKSVSFTFL